MHGVRFILGMMLLVLFAALIPGLITVGVAAESFNSVYLSEFLAVNKSGLRDENEDFSPWLELHNGGSTVVNLAGWFLTDTQTNLTRWRFPNVGILPGKELVVFASGKNRTGDPLHLHT